MPVFERSFTVGAPLADLAAFHRSTTVLKRLTPPPVIVHLRRVEPLAEGSIAEFILWFGPIPVRWTARHTNVDPLCGFVDTQIQGPMRAWQHTHTFSAEGPNRSRVTDRVIYKHAPRLRGLFTRLLFSRLSLRLLFAYRAWATRRAVTR